MCSYHEENRISKTPLFTYHLKISREGDSENDLVEQNFSHKMILEIVLLWATYLNFYEDLQDQFLTEFSSRKSLTEVDTFVSSLL